MKKNICSYVPSMRKSNHLISKNRFSKYSISINAIKVSLSNCLTYLPIILLLFTFNSFSLPKILILHSYHITEWTEGVQSGLKDGFKQFPETEMYIEYMDTKKIETEDYLNILRSLYIKKYSREKFSVIIIVDNPALNFTLKNRNELFGTTPVVFCGINNFNSLMLSGQSNITGVVERADFDQTIDIALKARPDCDTFFIINDKTESGLNSKKEFIDALTLKSTTIIPFSLEDLTLSELTERIRNTRNQDLVLFSSFWKDRNNTITTPQTLEPILRSSTAPVFGRSEWMISRGITGGRCVTAYSQGATAAALAVRIYNGESAEKIPVVTDSPNRFIFNMDEIRHHKIPKSIIPKDAIILGNPSGIALSIQILIMVFAILILLIISIVLLFIYIRMRNSSIANLKESEEKYRQLIESSDLLVAKLTPDGTISFVNQKSEKFISFSPSECIGKRFTDFIHPDDILQTNEKLKERLSQKPSCTFENRVISKSGKVFHFLWSVIAIKDLNGNCTGYNAIGRDISSYKEIQNQLQHASKMKAIGTLAGGIAHDFNNLLAGILGYTEVALLDLPEAHSTRTHLLEIKKISMRARELIRHILTFSRQTPFDPYPVRIHEIIEEVIPLLRATIPSTIEIRTEIENCGTILADQSRIHQILMNLSTNSYHAMEEKGGILSISLHKSKVPKDNLFDIPEGQYIELSIKDTGSGIPPEFHNHIFDPFFTTKKVNKGTGLGLSVVHGIVTELNSYIRFSSEVGKGSVFTIYFPPSSEKIETHADISQHENAIGGNETIIVVDDEEIIAGSMNALLKKHGYKTCVFTSSKLAYTMITSKKVIGDLLITDMTMPELTGIDLVNKLAVDMPNLPIILCTGYSDQTKQELVQGNDVAAFLTKPIDTKNLLKTIRSILDIKR
jgi:two-component system, cell cycle sensor histidine kinase and response regulator CckA